MSFYQYIQIENYNILFYLKRCTVKKYLQKLELHFILLKNYKIIEYLKDYKIVIK